MTLLIDVSPLDSSPSLGLIQLLGLLKSNLQYPIPPQKQNIAHLPLLLSIFTGFDNFFVIYVFLSRPHQHYGVIMFPLYLWLIIQYFMLEPNTLRMITTLFGKKFFAKISPFVTYLPPINLLILTKPLLSPTFLHLRDKLLTQPESSV